MNLAGCERERSLFLLFSYCCAWDTIFVAQEPEGVTAVGPFFVLAPNARMSLHSLPAPCTGLTRHSPSGIISAEIAPAVVAWRMT